MGSIKLTKIGLTLLIIFLFAASCSPAFANTPILNTTLATLTLTMPQAPSQTTIPTLVLTRTPTIIPTPLGAGLESPTFQVKFLTPFEELSSGDYAIIPVAIIGEQQGYDLYYLRLDGKKSGKLLSITSSGNEKMGIGTRPLNNGRELLLKWISNDTDVGGFLLLDLETQKVQQYSMGCPNAVPIIHSSYVSPGNDPFIPFSCEGKHEIWNFVSPTDWQMVSEVFPEPSSENHQNDIFFLNDNLVLISDSFPYSKSDVKCLYKIKEAEKTCFTQVPNWWNPVSKSSSDGDNVVVWISDGSGEYDGHGGIVPLMCIEMPDAEDCVPEEFPELEGVPFWAPGSLLEKYWSPDGKRIIGQYVSDDLTTSRLWIYDAIEHQIQLLGIYPVLEFRGNPWVVDGDQVIAQSYSSSAKGPVGWAISTSTGKMERIDERLPNLMYNWSLINVP